MKRPLKWMSRWLEAAQRRFGRARPGSVLIMVVSLLVLLALIGTAAMSTARMDRVSSGQNVANTQVDLLAEGVKQMVISQLVADLYDFKDTTSSDSLKDFFNSTDSTASDTDQGNKGTRDAMLGSRIPDRFLLANPQTISGSLGIPLWRSISYPPILNGNATAGNNFSQYRFDPPNEAANNDNPFSDATPATRAGFSYALSLPKLPMEPVSIIQQGETFPAFQPVFPSGNRGRIFMAADTDGDGIADAFLFRLPISPIRGITYYGAIRVVDNSAAININTAGNPNNEFAKISLSGTGGLSRVVSFAGIYPASVNVDGLLAGNAETDPRDNQLFTGDATKSAAFSGNVIGDVETVPGSGIYDKPDPRNDSLFLTRGDALHHQLGRRLDNPGFYDTNGNRYGGGVRPFGIGGSMSLAYGFMMVNPSARTSLIERILPTSLVDGSTSQKYAWKPYAPGDAAGWFSQNFDYDLGGFTLSRALITTYNPVRNGVLRRSLDPAIKAKYTSKTNINTATFEELQASFQDVMSDGFGTRVPGASSSPFCTPFDDDTAAALGDPYLGMKFNSRTYAGAVGRHPAEMFRSPLRPSGGAASARALHPSEVMQLRSSIAAMNALAMRNPNPPNPPNPVNNVLLSQLQLLQPVPTAGTPAKQYAAMIFSTKRQPFITEVFINNNPEKQVAPPPPAPPLVGPAKQNKSGFTAIELHNPYDEDMSLEGYSLKTLDRNSLASGYTNLAGADGNPAQTVFGPADIIPAHGYMVVWNYNGGAAGADVDMAEYLPADLKDITNNPAPFGVKVVYWSKLHELMDKELVVLQPVLNADPLAPEYFKWAPLDSFDCTGLPHQVAGPNPALSAEAWHYVRANDPRANSADFSSRAWHFVYPGRYDGSQLSRRHQGTDSTTFPPPTFPPPPAPPVLPPAIPWNPATDPDPWTGGPPLPYVPTTLGKPDPLNSRELVPNFAGSFPIQIGNTGMEDQFKLTVGPPKAFPMNGFARVGDIMQVPYIGSYVIVEVQVPLVAGTPPTLIEVNSVTMDAAFAEDTDISDDLDGQKYPEDIGRFVPMLPEVSAGPSFAPDLSSVAHVTGTMDSSGLTSFDDVLRTEKPGFWNNCDVIVYNTDQSATATWRRQFRSVTNSNLGTIKVNSAFNPALLANVRYIYKIQAPRYSHYGWAGDLPDYFTTIHAPADDYTPNVDPLVVAVPPKPKPDPVKNLSDPARATNRIGFVPPPGISTGPTEDDVPVEGLININIAGWKVLSALPLVMKRNPPPAPATIDVNLSENLAKRIVYFRDIDDGTGTPTNPHPHGPFKSIMELCLVPNFVSGEGTIRLSTIPNENPGIDLGDYSPLTQDPRGDNVRLDFKEKYLTLTRISNLITLRSDCFTVYLQVQGWQDAGSANAKLMVQRRLAFIVDRSRVTPLKPTPTVFNVQVPPSGR